MELGVCLCLWWGSRGALTLKNWGAGSPWWGSQSNLVHGGTTARHSSDLKCLDLQRKHLSAVLKKW